MAKFFERKKYNPVKKATELRRFKQSEVNLKKNKIVAKIPIRWISDTEYLYKLEVHIGVNGYFDAYIIEPRISYANGDPPHIYKSPRDKKTKTFKKLKLCLFYFKFNEYSWKDDVLKTIIAWAIKWTEFYEIWLLTGEWYGGGVHAIKDVE